MSNPELITAVDLDQWSGTLAAQTTLPILVRRLILATTPVGEITMRARQGALLPGWDGIVRSDVTDAHVPLGTPGWELGTSKDPREKAQSDLRSGARTRWAWTRRRPRSWRSRAASGGTETTGSRPGARRRRGPASAPSTPPTS